MKKRVKRRLRFIGIIFLLIMSVVAWSKIKQADSNNVVYSTTKETFKVVIDPGHGGKDVEAIGFSGLYEKDFNLSLSKKVKEILKNEDSIEVYMTREDDIFISTIDNYRTEFANELDADLYISIHGNTFDTSDISGTESYYYHEQFKTFAEVMHKNVVDSTGFKDRGVKKEELFVVRDTDMPSVLLDIGYLTNSQEEQLMFNGELQNLIAESNCRIYMQRS